MEIKIALEALVDRYGLVAVVRSLATVAGEKADTMGDELEIRDAYTRTCTALHIAANEH